MVRKQITEELGGTPLHLLDSLHAGRKGLPAHLSGRMSRHRSPIALPQQGSKIDRKAESLVEEAGGGDGAGKVARHQGIKVFGSKALPERDGLADTVRGKVSGKMPLKNTLQVFMRLAVADKKKFDHGMPTLAGQRNESVSNLISMAGEMRSYNILYTASRIGMLTWKWRLMSFMHFVP